MEPDPGYVDQDDDIVPWEINFREYGTEEVASIVNGSGEGDSSFTGEGGLFGDED